MAEPPSRLDAPRPSNATDPLAETLAGSGGHTTRVSDDSGASEDPSGARAGASRATPDRYGRYRLVRKLGEGGMGLVHLAHDDELDRPVAIKILRPEGNGDSRRLLREARSMARLSHPHIASVYDVGIHDGDVYVAMEYVEGPTLRRWLETPRPWAERLDVLTQAARGLAAAHAVGVVHRDFKPDNVIIGRDGRVRVLDFGLAKLAPRAMGRSQETTDTQLGSFVGTPRYMAPEQLRTQPAGPAADQFAFCITAYEVAYGRRPFTGEVFADVAVSVLTQPPREPPEPADVPVALWPVLRQGLQVDPAARHESMLALVERLERLAGALAKPEPEPEVVSRPALRDAREDARAQLTAAYADDLIDADELDERLERLENAPDPQAVRGLVADLAPAPAVVPSAALALAMGAAATPETHAMALRSESAPAVAQGNLPAVIDVPPTGQVIAVFSGARRAGVWTPARVNQVYTVFGGAEIDLREARLPPGEVEFRVLVIFGGLEITVPPGVHVQLECSALFGGAEQEDASAPPEPGGTTIRITGFVMFGGVEVVERLPGEGGWAARKRRKQHQRALREAAKANKALPPRR